jgi:hypothetical protein
MRNIVNANSITVCELPVSLRRSIYSVWRQMLQICSFLTVKWVAEYIL